MKIYLIQISIKPKEIDPFRFIKKCKDAINLWLSKKRIRSYYLKQNWDGEYIRSQTYCSGTLNEAVDHLTIVLMMQLEQAGIYSFNHLHFDSRKRKFIQSMIMKDFETGKF